MVKGYFKLTGQLGPKRGPWFLEGGRLLLPSNL
jgi:hypothetical protein